MESYDPARRRALLAKLAELWKALRRAEVADDEESRTLVAAEGLDPRGLRDLLFRLPDQAELAGAGLHEEDLVPIFGLALADAFANDPGTWATDAETLISRSCVGDAVLDAIGRMEKVPSAFVASLQRAVRPPWTEDRVMNLTDALARVESPLALGVLAELRARLPNDPPEYRRWTEEATATVRRRTGANGP